MSSIIKYIKDNVSPEEYYQKIFPNISWTMGTNEARVLSPFIAEKIPSLSINKETGAWYSFCGGDEHGGRNIVSFHAALNEISYSNAARELFRDFVHPTVPQHKIKKWMRELTKTPSIVSYLKSRCISSKVAYDYQLGWDGSRVSLPILNEFKIPINVKLFSQSKRKSVVKVINYSDSKEARSYGSPTMLFPLEIMKDNNTIAVCEGEWDVLALLSLKIPAVTTTTGSNSWPQQYNHLFRGKTVVVIPDNDRAGDDYKKLVIKNLRKIAKKIKVLELPKEYNDVNDYIIKWADARHKKKWLSLIKTAKVVVKNTEEMMEIGDSNILSLDIASEHHWYNQPICVDALITGKGTAPYILPKKYQVTCEDECEGCPFTVKGEEVLECEIDVTDKNVLKMLDVSESTLRKLLLIHAYIPYTPACSGVIDVTETFNIEQLILIPTLDSNSSQYVTRSGYYVGHGLHSNKSYRFEGKVLPHPKNQITTFLFNDAKPSQSQIETFKMTKEIRKSLQIFRPRNLKPFAHLMSIAEWQSRNITKIHSRPDLHMAIDLVFHSVSSFMFNDEYVHRGMLDVLVLGDTRCGKGYVAEGLKRHYKVGEIASGENCSFAGLVGGVQQISNRWFITWGLIPLNHKRLVIIDEVSSIKETELGKMSRVRSEGVAEISKIVREITQANTRLVWLSNTRSGRSINTYNTGIEAVRELMGSNEDISRFDFALTVATNEVDSEIINALSDHHITDSGKYPKEVCRNLILWAWSRTTGQIEFKKGATLEIIREAIEFGKKYSSAIPLVQAENVRIKLAKISAAIAARMFSSDENGEKLIIKVAHVKCAAQFLRWIYSKASMGYDLYSKTTLAASKVKGSDDIDKIMKSMGPDYKSAVIGLIELHKITVDNLSDYVGDIPAARMLIGDLVRNRCLARIEGGNWYLKNPKFHQWLRKKIKGIAR